MVTLAPRTNDWNRASYLDLDGASRAPQAISALLPQVLARYALPATEPNPVSGQQELGDIRNRSGGVFAESA